MLAKLKQHVMRQINLRTLKKHRVTFADDLSISGRIYIDTAPTASIQIGQGVCIKSSYKANPVAGVFTKLIAARKGQICIGDRVGISNATVYAFDKITIEDDVLIGADAKLYDCDFHPIDFADRIAGKEPNARPICIQQGAFLGAGVTVLKGVTIGAHSVVGAGSVVTKDIPAGEIWGGAPAQFIKRI